MRQGLIRQRETGLGGSPAWLMALSPADSAFKSLQVQVLQDTRTGKKVVTISTNLLKVRINLAPPSKV